MIRERESLEAIAMLALEFGRLLMEAGSSARHVDEITTQVAIGLGAERLGLRVATRRLAITISAGPDAVSQMRRVGPLGVNESPHRALKAVSARIARGGFTVDEARTELMDLLHKSPRHS